MNRARTNFFIDLVLFVSMLVVFFTGIILWGWTRPAGMMGPHGAAPAHGHGAAAAASPRGDAAPAEAPSPDAPPAEAKQDEGKGPGEKAAGAPHARAKVLWGLTEASEDGRFWGMKNNEGWKQIHCWVGMTVLLLFLIFHLAMHWDWICAMCGCRCAQRAQEEQKKLQE